MHRPILRLNDKPIWPISIIFSSRERERERERKKLRERVGEREIDKERKRKKGLRLLAGILVENNKVTRL